LELARPTVLWGGNHFASRLPDSSSWLFWDKRDSQPEIDNACGEMAWSNLGGPVRRFMYLWRGLVRAGEGMGGATGSMPHLHPTQKPVALCQWVYQRAKLKRGDLVFVPWMGSGPDLAACVAMGLRCIAVDCEEWCCQTAVGARLHAVSPTATLDSGPLFRP
jgi:site-specific DNA-methyltransferase (adenine-specific)/modification methylase